MFADNGARIAVTVVAAGPCWVTQITDGRVQFAFGNRKHLTQSQAGQLKKAGLDIKPRFLREIKLENPGNLSLGQIIKVESIFAPGDRVKVTGISKGKGFAGVVRRHGFAGGPRTHGQSDRERAPGSIGMTTTPGRVFRGKRMAGRMGNERVTTGKLTVLAVDPDKNLLMIKGLVPGARGGLLIIQKQV